MDTPIKQTSQSVQETKAQQMQARKQLAKIYRLFSSKKYMKYKHQFPRMKETEIVNKIIKEWQLMSMEEKLGLGEVYSKKEMLDSESDGEGSNFSEDRGKKSTVKKSGCVSVQKSDVDRKIQAETQGKKPQSSPLLEKKIEQLSSAMNKIQLQNNNHSQAKISQQQSKIEHRQEQPQSSQQQLSVSVKHKIEEKQQSIELQRVKYKLQKKQQQQSQQQNLSQSSSGQDNSQSISPNTKNKSSTRKINTKASKNQTQQTPSIANAKVNKKKLIKKQKSTEKQSLKKQINYLQLKNGQYLLFYKYYFQKLKQQHPKWAETQITFIIKLLWKKHSQKRKLNSKEAIKKEREIQKQAANPSKPKRPISGKEYFINEKQKEQLIKQEINMLWKQLPRESKSYWNKMALQFNMKNAINSRSIKTDSNIKSQTTAAKAQIQEPKMKTTVVTFRDLLLKGRVTGPSIDHIIEEKKESLSHSGGIPRQKTLQNYSDKSVQQNQSTNQEDVHYVSLQTNPFAFMMKKIDNKILLE